LFITRRFTSKCTTISKQRNNAECMLPAYSCILDFVNLYGVTHHLRNLPPWQFLMLYTRQVFLFTECVRLLANRRERNICLSITDRTCYISIKVDRTEGTGILRWISFCRWRSGGHAVTLFVKPEVRGLFSRLADYCFVLFVILVGFFYCFEIWELQPPGTCTGIALPLLSRWSSALKVFWAYGH
jgi:hypothetical protein